MKITKFMVLVGRGGLCSSIALNPCTITKPLMKDINGPMTIRMAKSINNVMGDNLIPTGVSIAHSSLGERFTAHNVTPDLNPCPPPSVLLKNGRQQSKNTWHWVKRCYSRVA